MITGYAQNGEADCAARMFLQMHSAGFASTEFTFVGILNVSSDMGALVVGKQAHGLMVKLGFERQVYVKSALVDMYAGHVQNGEHEEALMLYSGMDKEGVMPSYLTVTSVLRACACLAALEPGKQLHAQILKCGFGLGGMLEQLCLLCIQSVETLKIAW
jgi:pentatricopeptide repeat protein